MHRLRARVGRLRAYLSSCQLGNVLRLLADENLPRTVIAALASAGHDTLSLASVDRGAADEAVLELAVNEQRIILTMDKDFGELVYHRKHPAPPGVILIRPPFEAPDMLATRIVSVLESRDDWEGHMSIIEATRIRMRPLRR